MSFKKTLSINNAHLASSGMLKVTVARASEVDEALATAFAYVQPAVTERRSDILITRTGAGDYDVRADLAVP
ncbi:hypothetical protein [Paenarthrobacter sp. A20]|uniref:hypothetical protein n=1 Tax=Paenarthrobacter sp. A20 TaxID=2817891 RepID=UPI0020A02938|nr:hypothetical protein [Paenarthrobacter sp. A20]MCP1415524.1 hypothetical protein [Paenarthrobacter sp. A20]